MDFTHEWQQARLYEYLVPTIKDWLSNKNEAVIQWFSCLLVFFPVYPC